MAESETPTTPRGWLRRYPPLITFVVALLIMLVIMPSALNLPQSNPSTVLEYAPIPPEDEDEPPPQEGSLSSLSLGTSDTIETGVAPEEAPPVKQFGQGDKPIVKRCVGDPPRQTEDPNSPPCVPFFTGDNGGATFRGVSKDEITVVIYSDTRQTVGGDDGYETTPPANEICDVDSPPDDPENIGCSNGEGTRDHSDVAVARALSRYFNERFQTYDRHVHFYIYWGAGSGGPTGRRSDVQDIFERLKPYSLVDNTVFGDTNPFIEAAVKRQITVYGSYAALPNKTFRENSPFLWGFWPDVEHSTAMFHDYICKRVAPFKVSHSGNSDDIGKPRKYGLLYTTDQSYPGHRYMAEILRGRLRKGCPNGAEFDIGGEYTYPNNGWSVDSDTEAIVRARENVARMQDDEITTVVKLGGQETEHSKAANDTDWYPEWVLAGDLTNDQTEENGQPYGQHQTAWQHAWTMSHFLRDDKLEESPCHNAALEGDPEIGTSDENSACGLYRAFFMLFRGIQVAGPFLTPNAVDQGNHSLARIESKDPRIATCFFDPGDYTCVKDSQESWWDPEAPDPNGNPEGRGCWRMSDGGRRYTAGKWPEGDDVFKTEGDVPCNTPTDNGVTVNT